MRIFVLVFFLGIAQVGLAQSSVADSVDAARLRQMISLSEVVLDSKLDVARFIEQVKNDTTFYKAFRNLRVLEFTSSNDILLKDLLHVKDYNAAKRSVFILDEEHKVIWNWVSEDPLKEPDYSEIMNVLKSN